MLGSLATGRTAPVTSHAHADTSRAIAGHALAEGALRLAEPGHVLMDGYVAALRAGWSPDNLRDVSGEQLALLDAGGPGALLAAVTAQDGWVRLADGSMAERVPSKTFWLDDGGFAGMVTVRHQPGRADLPAHVPGHIGYAVVPWRRGRGYAGAALRAALPVARALGLLHADLCCAHDNIPSRRAIVANGGRLVGLGPHPFRPGKMRLLYRIGL